MTKNRIRVAAAAAALIPMIALGSGFATAAPADSVVSVADPVPVQVEPVFSGGNPACNAIPNVFPISIGLTLCLV
ncbi:hypothetical protein [Nocardia rhizosphaerihabitans]|uniref:Chaplin domain-containing protein n=1 Tax=Nocardia rhizosphaerihabitans TaxID=1691570 RepID=A0ABQ2KBX6_9NOCA|nr:hypothetical protein [Nocardia rhizosphaerihabitans]GGN78070.1 hypothetical protein GCM10011610_25230 [Nocardia rhizosphaerihabitans]